MTLNDPQILDENLFSLFASQARRRPDATAVIDDSGATSYRKLEARACQIANALTVQELEAEQAVGVLMDRESDLLAALLGVLGAGGCYVPLDPEDPPERTRRIVTGAGCRLVLGHRLLLQKLQAAMSNSTEGVPEDFRFMEIEGIARGSTEPCSLTEVPPGGSRLAYILFTSGSTGIPKGVEVEHRHVVNLLLSGRDLLGVNESDRYLATSTVGFDSSVAEMYLPMITGATVVLHDRSLVLEPRRLANEIDRHAITVLMTGPSVWSVAFATIADFPRVRIAISHGEVISPDLASRLLEVADAAWNLYGPTETTVWATGHQLGRDQARRPMLSPVSAPIGRPLTHLEVRVLDEQQVAVPLGSEGELWIGGASLARGYRGDDELTRKRFVSLDGNGNRFYRTGDIVAEDATGTLHYFGRNDDQLKVRGVRIEPMEVESAVLSHSGVAQAAATWFPTITGSRSIVVGVVTKPGSRVDSEILHEHLNKILSASMVPSRFIFCDALPLLPSGKVDRGNIRAQVMDTPVEADPAPHEHGVTKTENTLIQIWERTLGVGRVNRTDHFFTIGGDSLSAVTVMLEVEAAFDISITVRVLFENPTVDQLAECIERERPQPDRLANTEFVFPLKRSGRGAPVFFCSVHIHLVENDLWRADCPLYAISLWARGGSRFVQAKSIEEFARSFIENIRAIQPRGPYRLAGYSFGGMIAYEIAQQMRQAGEEIELLFLLDPSGLDEGESEATSEGMVASIARHLRHLGQHPSEAVSYLLPRARNYFVRGFWRWLCYRLVYLHARHTNPITTRLLPKNRWQAFWPLIKRFGKSYKPDPYDSDVLAFFRDRSDGHSAWQSLLGASSDIRFIESEHAGLFSEPALSQWMGPLSTRLDEPPDSDFQFAISRSLPFTND